MSRNLTAIALLALGALPLWAQAPPDLKAVVDNSRKAMGATEVKTITISGEGWDGCVGQPYDPYSQLAEVLE